MFPDFGPMSGEARRRFICMYPNYGSMLSGNRGRNACLVILGFFVTLVCDIREVGVGGGPYLITS